MAYMESMVASAREMMFICFTLTLILWISGVTIMHPFPDWRRCQIEYLKEKEAKEEEKSEREKRKGKKNLQFAHEFLRELNASELLDAEHQHRNV